MRAVKRIIAVQQRKGGATKTTTAAELVALAAEAGHRVLAVEMDEARALSVRMGFGAYDVPELTTMDFLRGRELGECVTESPTVEGVQVLQGGPGLDEVSDLAVTTLRNALPRATQWDVAVIDTPGDFGHGTAAAIAAADVVVIPVPAEGESLLVLDKMSQWRASIVRRLRRGLGEQEVWYVPNKVDRRQTLDRELIEVLESRYPGRVTLPVRKVGTSATQSFIARMPLSVYAPDDGVSADYRAALTPFIQGI